MLVDRIGKGVKTLVKIGALAYVSTGCGPQTISVSDLIAAECARGAETAHITLDIYRGSDVSLGGNTFVSDGEENFHTKRISSEGMRVVNGSTFYWDTYPKRWTRVEGRKGKTAPNGDIATQFVFDEDCPATGPAPESK
ncbi:hypothetical protein A3D00_03770 [Candidatus Woesebacteria bacterium RIFCSPHIGHO2_02_FULL_38_9]|uniref:Lipoprotein n=1 Tax=Candidatus Woesebacteria bacterium RIFCSPHIGHO2_01_FULL_39_28 TaxID=1802496 RepID=A0A1F7YCG9_9BACT|nr:MAG: hypothetical protein A2627_04985 [Candidatus Woesebacteria bacterium RIFCSPHIGHO2_01_FULL_39_28]OGM33949.1 MAG: hypothetical protein A3D00_03770 [Candidatus Woesebacteria bacterium RIFCSPHIGHO2_02_FULL_38_9]OGM57548.1 MAG: hypothetical protein A3A50_06100 [Candidatus Woesebacteria bacterium RIFCSPLOWO2_01_FULL_38_20]